MEGRSWHSSWLVPLNKFPALLCPFTSDTRVYPWAACALLLCHALCCPRKHTQLCAERPTYLDIHTHWITLRCTLIATLADGLWSSWARLKFSSNLPPLCPQDRGCSSLLEETDCCSVFAQPPVYSQGHGEKLVMPPAMWRERVNVDTSFFQPTYALRSAFEGYQHAELRCFLLVGWKTIHHFIAEFTVSFLGLSPPCYHPKVYNDHYEKFWGQALAGGYLSHTCA